MPVIATKTLKNFTAQIFRAYGLPERTAEVVADSLVLSNLKGHDSHGVIRIIDYTSWLPKGWFNLDAEMTVVRDEGMILMIDGDFGFGQVIGRQATQLAIDKTQREGACIMTIRRSGHLGRIGEYMEMSSDAGLLAFAFTNTHGGCVLAAPYGGREPRLSANPVAAAAPQTQGEVPIIMDMATCSIAEGKIKVARAAGKSLPPGCIINSEGRPSTDPEDYYSDPPGALLPMAGHKGFALALVADIFAGALSGAGCSSGNTDRVANALFMILVDPDRFCGRDFYLEQVNNLANWVKSSKLMEGFDEILLPGDPEATTHQKRREDGIPIDDVLWQKIREIASAKDLAIPQS